MSDWNHNVFINCPFQDKYANMLKFIMFALIYCGFEPKLASVGNSSKARMHRIKNCIIESRYSIHEMTNLKPFSNRELMEKRIRDCFQDIEKCHPNLIESLDEKQWVHYVSGNMPFELGYSQGFQESNPEKSNLMENIILVDERDNCEKALSDILGNHDSIMEHHDEFNISFCKKLYIKLATWEDNPNQITKNASNLFAAYHIFTKEAKEDFTSDFDSLHKLYITKVKQYLESNPPVPLPI